MVSRSRIPPPSCTGISSPMTLTTSRITDSFFGLPANAPFRSTMCSRPAPSSSQCCAIAAGSSENTVAECISPCFRRTQCPSLISIAGMMCMAAVGSRPGERREVTEVTSGASVPGDEVGKQLETGAVTLLWMELHGKDISACNRASKRRWIIDAGGRQRTVIRHRVVAMCEIEAGCVSNALPKRVRPRLANAVPAHVRDLEPGAARIDHRSVRETFHAAMQQAEAGSGPFLALVEKHLQSQADAEKWAVANDFLHDVAQAALVEAAHAIGHRT